MKKAIAGWLLVGVACVALGAVAPPHAAAPASAPSAAQIVEKNAAARGGIEAWQRLHTMAWTGYAQSGATPGHKLPFMLEQKRPNKTRFELVTDGKRSIRVYDGNSGWKLRPNPGNGRPELTPYTDDELKYARGAQVIDGPLMDYVAKGAVVTLGGQGGAEGRRAYILDVKLPSGGIHHIWVDAETFLEVRQDRQVRNGAGQIGMVTMLFDDYREFDGVKIPTKIETGATTGAAANKLVIERVALNPEFDDRMFARPDTPVSRKRSVVVDTRSAASPGAPTPVVRP